MCLSFFFSFLFFECDYRLRNVVYIEETGLACDIGYLLYFYVYHSLFLFLLSFFFKCDYQATSSIFMSIFLYSFPFFLSVITRLPLLFSCLPFFIPLVVLSSFFKCDYQDYLFYFYIIILYSFSFSFFFF